MSAGIGKVFPVLAVAGIAAVGWFVFRPDSTGGKPTAANVLREGMSALSSLRSVYVRANARIPSTGDFNAVGGEYELQPIEMWKEFGESSKWRVENAGRVAVMDGQASLLLIQPAPPSAQRRRGGGRRTNRFRRLVSVACRPGLRPRHRGAPGPIGTLHPESRSGVGCRRVAQVGGHVSVRGDAAGGVGG